MWVYEFVLYAKIVKGQPRFHVYKCLNSSIANFVLKSPLNVHGLRAVASSPIDDYAKDGGPEGSDIYVVFTKILCGRNFCVLKVTNPKFAGQL